MPPKGSKAPVQIDKLVWKWAESVDPENIQDEHILTSYRLCLKKCVHTTNRWAVVTMIPSTFPKFLPSSTQNCGVYIFHSWHVPQVSNFNISQWFVKWKKILFSHYYNISTSYCSEFYNDCAIFSHNWRYFSHEEWSFFDQGDRDRLIFSFH